MRDLIRMRDGRTLLVERSGDLRGQPVFLLHGMPGSRVGPRPRAMVLYQRGTQLISYDRPGYGGSDRHAGRRVADAVHDIADIADAFGLDRFAVGGRSGGAPHALACAALMPERVTRAAAMVSLAPKDAEGLDWFAGMAQSNIAHFRAAFADPEQAAAWLIPRSAAIRKDPVRLLDELRQELTDDDRRIVSDNGIRSMLLRNYREALRTSPYGWIDDLLALCRPWGFDPAGIQVPVLLWHGADDVFSPASHSSWLAARIPRSQPVVVPDAAHFASIRALPEVLGWLVADRPSTSAAHPHTVSGSRSR